MSMAQSIDKPSTPLTSNRTVLFLLVLTFACNFADRTIINTVGEAIKHDLRLSDTQLGLLGGLSFAFLYSIVGIPIARLADRISRKRILVAALSLWSLMTMLCSAASGYLSLLLMRIGVGVGEAACSPTSQSIIADYFPARKRASAISILYLGIPLGVVCSAFGTGYIVEHYGWREAFLVVGAPGLLLAVFVGLILKEPPRGRFDPPADGNEPAPTTRQVLSHMIHEPGLMFVAFAIMFSGMSAYSFGQFFHPLLVRFSGMGYAEAAGIFGIISVLTMGIGSPLGGYVTERFAKRDARLICWLPAIGIALSVPLKVAGFLSGSDAAMLIMIAVGGALFNMYHGPAFAAIHNRTPASMRATATSIAIFLSAFVGLGMGPLITGLFSDAFANGLYVGPGTYSSSCGFDALDADPRLGPACKMASGMGLRYALVGAQLFSALGALCLAIAGWQIGRAASGERVALGADDDVVTSEL